jgi:hypothetical protein
VKHQSAARRRVPRPPAFRIPSPAGSWAALCHGEIVLTVWTRPHDRRLGRSEYRGSGAHSRFPGSQPSGRAGASPRQGQVSAAPVRRTLARSRCHRPRRVGGGWCLTRRPGGPADRRRRVRRCRDHRCRGGRQRTPGAEAPGSIRKPPEGGCEVHSGSGRSAGWRRRVDQPASAGLGTEPGRSRPGDRGSGRSADRRCVSGETCRPP